MNPFHRAVNLDIRKHYQDFFSQKKKNQYKLNFDFHTNQSLVCCYDVPLESSSRQLQTVS